MGAAKHHCAFNDRAAATRAPARREKQFSSRSKRRDSERGLEELQNPGMNILGINAYHGNSSAALVCDGRLVAAVEEERFNRVKYAAGFPANAVRHCLAEAGLTAREIDHVAVPRDPWARMGTKLFYALRMPRFALERSKVLTRF